MNTMVNRHCSSFAILLLLCCQLAAQAQPTASFTGSPLAGCSPLVVRFSDASSGNPTQWKWDLGNGVISLLQHPSTTYFTPGTYNVKLVVRNAAGTADSLIKNQYVTVYAPPSPGFTADKRTGCFPLPVNFTDQSTAGEGTIASWYWDFGDGTTSALASPAHTYTSAGAYTVTLKIVNSFGCTETVSQQQCVTVSNGVKAAFTNTIAGVCAPPSPVQFNNASTGPGPLTYSWSFGDGGGGSVANPLHTYLTTGNFSVRLIASSPQGCSDTILKNNLISIGTTKASFTVADSVCVNAPVLPVSTSSPTPLTYLWTFGNGSFSTLASPATSYGTPGTYTIKLVNNFGGCFDSTTKQVQVFARLAPQFDADAKVFCSVPATVNFTNLTTGSTSVSWNFGDGTTSVQNNPSHTYTAQGVYAVTLLATNASGCTDSLKKLAFITIKKPKVNLTSLPKTGCTPLTIQPGSVCISGHTIISYSWNFGDGTYSTLPNPSHTYNTTGSYTVTLVYTTSGGCTDSTVLPNAVRTGAKPKAAFTYTPTEVCAFQAVTFTDASTPPVTQWIWSFGDGLISTLQNPVHQYQDTGRFHVQLIVFNNTCPDTIRVLNAVHIKPPIARFNIANDCSARYTKTFTDVSIGATSWFWNFGDGATSTQQNPAHTYNITGTFQVSLTVSNDTCSQSITHRVYVLNERARFDTPDTVICRNSRALFTPVGIKASNVTSWYWNFGDGTWSNVATAVSHVYPTAGTYAVSLVITDLLGCRDSTTTIVKVLGPVASFSLSSGISCLYNNSIAFNDASTSDGINPIVKRIWNYGDGMIDSTSSSPFIHSYSAAGSYPVSLIIKDNYGCADTSTKPAAILISQPKPIFNAPDTVTCTGKAIAFNNLSTGNTPQFIWGFGDGGTTTTASPTHSYNATGVYSVSLFVTDQYGCKDSLIKPNYIKVSYPTAKFTVSDSAGTCPPLLVHFYNASTDYSSRLWDFGDGSTSTLDSPSHFYTLPGTYYATLTVKGPGGCTEIATQKISIKGPSGSLTYTPLTGCKPLTVNFQAFTQNNAAYTWDFADGNIVLSPDSVIAHTYINEGDYTPKIILTDAGGCSVPIVGLETIKVSGAVAGFTVNESSFCNDALVQFTNTTTSNDPVVNYGWDFGDGSTGNTKDPLHQYTTPGLYTVSLNILTQNGCRDSLTRIDTIKVYRNPAITVSGNSAGCLPVTSAFAANVVIGDPSKFRWMWVFGNGQTDTSANPAPQVYTIAGSYTASATVTDDHGCINVATQPVEVYPLPPTSAGPDVAVCQGSFAQLTATGAASYFWNANPSLSCTVCAAPLAAPNDSVLYVVKGVSQFNCVAYDSVFVRVHHPFVLSVGKGDTVCVGKAVSLSASGAQKYTWLPGVNVANPLAGITTAIPAVSTLYTVVAKDTAGCFTDTGYVNIKVWPYPKVDAGADKTVSIGTSFVLQPQYSTDIVQYQWTNPMQTLSCVDCPAPMVRPHDAKATYTIQVKNNGGCTTTDDITVYAICNGGNLFIPNTFSPNADGKNETFYPRGTGISLIKSLRIYNRWGEVVFNSVNADANNAAAGWDGNYKGKVLPPDVYVYTCEVVCMNNEVLIYKGDVTLLR